MKYRHAPKNYICPFCLVVKGVENEHVETKKQDVFYKDKYITAFVSSCWWPKNPGYVIIIPNKHYENIYSIPDICLDKIHRFAKKVAIAFKKVYKCDGVSTRQHNEPAGDQDTFHFHFHVSPRYENDNLYLNNLKKRFISPRERVKYAKKLRRYFGSKNKTMSKL